MSSNLVLTSYFTSKKDPQRDYYRHSSSFNLMRNWWESLHKHGLEGVIFHDGIYDNFRNKYKSDYVTYEEVGLGPRSTNDERFYIYLDWLKGREDVEKVLLTDLFDIEFYADPFELFDSTDHKLYCGGEEVKGDESEWMQHKMRLINMHRLGLNLDFLELPLLNPGILGGEKSIVMEVVEEMCDEMDRLPESLNANMAVFNMVARRMFEDEEIMYNRPLNSRYKQYECDGDFYIRHK